MGAVGAGEYGRACWPTEELHHSRPGLKGFWKEAARAYAGGGGGGKAKEGSWEGGWKKPKRNKGKQRTVFGAHGVPRAGDGVLARRFDSLLREDPQ